MQRNLGAALKNGEAGATPIWNSSARPWEGINFLKIPRMYAFLWTAKSIDYIETPVGFYVKSRKIMIEL